MQGEGGRTLSHWDVNHNHTVRERGPEEASRVPPLLSARLVQLAQRVAVRLTEEAHFC